MPRCQECGGPMLLVAVPRPECYTGSPPLQWVCGTCNPPATAPHQQKPTRYCRICNSAINEFSTPPACDRCGMKCAPGGQEPYASEEEMQRGDARKARMQELKDRIMIGARILHTGQTEDCPRPGEACEDGIERIVTATGELLEIERQMRIEAGLEPWNAPQSAEGVGE